MMMKVVAYKDNKLNIFTQPFYLDGNRENADIVEVTRRMCTNPQMPAVYFEYDLYLLGTFDDKLGVFTCGAPEFLCSLADFKHLAPEKVEVVQDAVN